MAANTLVRHPAPIADAGSTDETALDRFVGVLFLFQFGVFAIALIALGRAINWPASLDEPAAVVLPLIRAQRDAVALGYASYLLSALLLLPITMLTLRALGGAGTQLANLGAAVGVVAALCKMLGILRWLTAMPALADAYTNPAASQATRDAVTVVYGILNSYAGGIGEILGVTLFAGLWTILVSGAILRRPTNERPFPRWLGWSGLVAGIGLLLGLAALAGRDLGGPYLTASGVIWQLWMVAMGLTFLRRRTP